MSPFDKNIGELVALSDLIKSQNFRRLQLKLLQPLIFHLGNTNSSDDKCALILCIIEVLKVTLVHNVCEFFDVYTSVFFQIFKGANLHYQPSEELKQLVLECCTYLMKNSTQNVLNKIYSEEFGAKFSLGISISVNIVKEEKNIKLRVAALDFLLSASHFETQTNYTEEIFNRIGDLFMLYLPGILAPLLEVILRNETQHHLITLKALSCWGHVVCIVMKDSGECDIQSDTEIIRQWLVNSKRTQDKVIDVHSALKEKKRTKLWLEAVALTLHPLIIKLSDLRKHSHSKCRLELTQMMVKLLRNCMRNLKNCLPIIIEVLVSSAVDEDVEVHQVAKSALNEFESGCNEKNVDIYASVIEENLYLIINKLPGIVKSGNEQLLFPLLKSFSGYLTILGRLNRLQYLISLSSTLKKIISVIKISFELETYPEISRQDFSIWESENSSQFWCKKWKRFRFFADESIETQLEKICRDLGKFGSSDIIFYFLLDAYNEDFLHRKEILLILSEVILGSEEIEVHVINHLLDFYLDPQNLYLPLQVNYTNCFNVKEAQSNIIQVALIMEGIGKLAKILGLRFQDYLLKSLYYVLERMGSNYSIIKDAATKCAVHIANACQLEGSLKSLIQNNFDYLTFHLTVKLKRNDDGVFDVIAVLIKSSYFETLPDLEDIINGVLKNSSQNFYSSQTLSYLKLLQTFVVWVRKWMKANSKPNSSDSRIVDSDVGRVVRYLESLTKGAELEGEKEFEIGEGQKLQGTFDDEAILNEYKKTELPRYLKVILEIAKHCLHYLASKDKNKKIIALEILDDCVWALADWEDDLLPLVHNIWSPLVTRFESSSDALIINRSFKLLCTLSVTSKDFIRKRTLSNVMPALEAFLIKQAPESKLKDSATGYFFTQNYKLQRELLGNLGKLTSNLGLFEKQTDLVVESALPYLSSFQPQELQEKCKTLFKDLIVYDEHLIWYKMNNLIKHPEFTKNAKTVLSSFGE